MTVTLVLASASKARAALLEAAGLTILCDPADVDEGKLKRACRDNNVSVEAAAAALAELKARVVARRHPNALVLGGDQILDVDGFWLDKPADRLEATAQLRGLRGRTHRLVSAAVLVRDENRVWSHAEAARLTMRPFSDAFLEHYLDGAGEGVFHTVGGYELEGLGAQLFERVDGDFFTVLGLPLLAVLEALRAEGVLPA